MGAEDAAQLEDIQSWGLGTGAEARRTFRHLMEAGILARYLSGADTLDVGYDGNLEDVAAVTPGAVRVALDQPSFAGGVMPFQDASQDAVFAGHVLQHVQDYRRTLQDFFRVLRVDGFLVIVVPHQFLYERKAQPPSRFDAGHRRFYTPAMLLREIEESLPPSSFRLRAMEENDRDFDYALPPSRHAAGGCEIVCVLEKIAPPAWSDAVFEGEQAHTPKLFRRQPQNTGRPEPLKVVGSAPIGVDSVLTMKLDHRGDFTMAAEAFAALRRNFAHAHLTLMCGPWNAADAMALGLFDEVIPFALFPENASQGASPFKTLLEAQTAFAEVLGERRFDVAVDLRWDEDTRFLLEAAPARRRAGFGTREVFDFLDVALPLRQETREGRADQRWLSAERFASMGLEHRGYAIVLPERATLPGDVIYGPYEALSAGRYWVDLLIEPLAEPFTIGFDMVHGGGNAVLTVGELSVGASGRIRVPLTLPVPVRDLEIRLRSNGGEMPPFRFFGCILQREGSNQGVHQVEAMLTLVEVVAARLALPYEEVSEAGPS